MQFPLLEVRAPLSREAVVNIVLGSNAFELYFLLQGEKGELGLPGLKGAQGEKVGAACFHPHH